MIPYSRQSIAPEDLQAVESALSEERITQGKKVEEFERALAGYCGARFAVVCSSGTAALHAAYFAAGLGAGDEFITSPMTFVATANAGLYLGAQPVFVDIDSTGNIDPSMAAAAITEKTKAIVPVDYTGRPAELNKIKELASARGLAVIEDACQSLGASYRGRKVGSIADLTVFSFHPVKSITTGEGGAILTNDEEYYCRLKMFVTHGITADEKFLKMAKPGEWYFEMQYLGYNYRLTDIQAALGVSQLKRADQFIAKRRQIAERYFAAFCNLIGLELPPPDSAEIKSSWHLFVVRFTGAFKDKRNEIFKKLRERGIGVQVHHIPVHLHPYYQQLGFSKGQFAKTEDWYNRAMSLPVYPDLTVADQNTVIDTVRELIANPDI